MKPRVLAGLMLVVGGMACFGAGAVIMREAFDTSRLEASRTRKTNEQCQVRLKELVGETGEVKIMTAPPNSFEVTVRNVTDPRKALSDASHAKALCPKHSLVYLCLGDKCDPSSKTVTLKMRMTGRQG